MEKKEYKKPELEVHKFKKFFFYCLCSNDGLGAQTCWGDAPGSGTGQQPITSQLDADAICIT